MYGGHSNVGRFIEQNLTDMLQEAFKAALPIFGQLLVASNGEVRSAAMNVLFKLARNGAEDRCDYG